MDEDLPVVEIVETLEEAVTEPETDIQDIIEKFGSMSIASALLAVGLLLVSPLSGIPVFSTICGAAIFLISVQGAFGRDEIWLPRPIMRYKLENPKFGKAFSAVRGAAEFLDKRTRPRLGIVVNDISVRGLFLISAVVGLCLPLLELVPFASSMIGAAVSLICIGVLARDGVISLFGLAIIPAAFSIPVFAYSALLF